MSNFRLDFLRGVSLKSCSRKRAVKLIVLLWPLQGSIYLVAVSYTHLDVYTRQLQRKKDEETAYNEASTRFFDSFIETGGDYQKAIDLSLIHI